MAGVVQNEKSGSTLLSPPHDGYEPASPTNSIALDKDIAIGLVGEHACEIDPAVEAKVLRKIDWFLIPAMIIGIYPSSSMIT